MPHPSTGAPYEEKSEDYDMLLPMRIARLSFPPATKNIFFLHWHQEFEFFYVTKGCAVFTVENREYTVRQGESIFVNANRLHSARGVPEEPCEFMAVVFFGSLIAEQLQGSFYARYVHAVIQEQIYFPEFLTPNEPRFLPALENLHFIAKIPADRTQEYELLLKGKMIELWHTCYTCSAPAGNKPPDSGIGRLKPVLQYIHRNYMYDITLQELSALLPMSTGQFCRIFKQHLHLTPIAYVMQHRILESCRLLSETTKRISEIANLTGFNNISYFNKTFHSLIGCTPTVYRKGGQISRIS